GAGGGGPRRGVRRTLAALLVLFAAAGCRSQDHGALPLHEHARRSAPAKPHPQPAGPPAKVQVTVVDGDTGARVRGARVTVGRHTARTDRRGVARLPLARRGAYVTVASKPGYAAREVRLPFRTHPQSTLRLYQNDLQWTMYGADPGRTQAHDALAVR